MKDIMDHKTVMILCQVAYVRAVSTAYKTGQPRPEVPQTVYKPVAGMPGYVYARRQSYGLPPLPTK